MKNWTVQKLVAAGFALIIVITAALCYFSFAWLDEISDETATLRDHDIEHLVAISGIQVNVYQNASHLGELLITENPARIDELVRAIRGNFTENQELFQKLKETARSETELKEIEGFLEKRVAYGEARLKVLNAKKEGEHEAARALFLNEVSPALEVYLAQIDTFNDSNREGATKAIAHILEGAAKTRRATLWATVVSLTVAIGIASLVVRLLSSTLRQLMMALIQVNSSTTEITATIKQQQVSANEVASTSVEVGATAKEISATTSELGRTMADVATVAEQTTTVAAGGRAGLSRLEGTMEQIMGATSTISAKLAILNEKTANINSMVTTINKVADQTNLLSLNAAIEAEKAGEFGQGFSVVATEIRRLADQTAVATYDIEQMVKEMQSAVSAGVMGMDKFAEEVRRGNEEVCAVTAQLVQIIQSVQALTPRFDSVNEGMKAQSTAAEQISGALVDLGETAQQSARALVQNNDAVEQLNIASQALQNAVRRFKSS